MSTLVLITGGAGFVGSHLADGLLRAGHQVRIFDELTPQVHPSGIPSYLAKDVEFIAGDIRNPGEIRGALAGVNAVYHFAARVGVGQSMYEIDRYMGVNTGGTAELLQAVLDAKNPIDKLIVASSMSIYGEGRYICSACLSNAAPKVRTVEQLKAAQWEMYCETCGGKLKSVPTDESKPSGINSIYALSKRDQEELCLIYGRTYGLPVTALRFFNIYGTRQALSNPYTGVAAVFASRILNGKQPLIFEDGEQMRDFVHVDDIVRANLCALRRTESNGQVINVGSGKPITIRQVAEKLAHSLGREVFPVITNKYRAGDIRHCYADISKARNLLGYEPQVSHDAGFRDLAEWLGGQKADDNAETMMTQLTTFGLTA